MNESHDIRRAMGVFDQVCDLASAERSVALEKLCEGDAGLRRRVEEMLASEEDGLALIAESRHGVGAGIIAEHLREEAAIGQIPERIGRYKIIRELGRGGMGIVFEAEQDSPKRRVALKLIRSIGMSPTLIKRFEREAYVLGQLQHPGIAHIYESGMTDIDGHRQPFLAMELIKGEHITAFAENQSLGLRERLELMARVCDAVQHAHQKGVIHRDLKPGNILVVDEGTEARSDEVTKGRPDGDVRDSRQSMANSKHISTTRITKYATTSLLLTAQPKILDFGVARFTDGDLQAVTLQTDPGQIVGTLAYMSPEQVAGDANAVDTRCDVYALGVLLFELLTDQLPLDVSGKPVAEAARIVRDEDPANISSINRSLRGDINTIIGKALEKDTARRYASAAELGADLRRYLRDEPIAARPASTYYHVRKFASRNRALVGGVVATFVALVVGLVSTSYYLAEAREQFARAEAERDEAIAARQEADEQRKRTNVVAGFQADLLGDLRANEFGKSVVQEMRTELERMLASADPDETEHAANYDELNELLSEINGTNVARAVLSGMLADRAIQRIDEGFTKDPVTEARLRYSVAMMYSNLRMQDEAVAQCQLALQLERKHLGDDHKATLVSMDSLALQYRRMGRVTEAEELYRESLMRRLRAFGDENKLTLGTMGRLAALLQYKGELDEAESLLNKALVGSEHTFGLDHDQTLRRRNTYCVLLLKRQKYDEALACFQSALETRERVFGLDHDETILIRNNLMGTLFKLGRFDEAEPVARDVLASDVRVLGDDHPNTITARNNLGVVLLNMNRFEEAESLFRAAYNVGRKSLNHENEVRMKSASNLIDALLAQDRPKQAETYCHELIAVRRSLVPAQPGLIAQTLEQLGHAHFNQQNYADARDAWSECVDLRASISNNHWLTNRARSELGSALAALGQLDEAESMLLDSYHALESQRETIPLIAGRNCLQDARRRISDLYLACGKVEEAKVWRADGDSGQ